MSNSDCAARNVVSLQERMFRLAERDYGLTAKVLHAETGYPISSLRDWRNGTAMPAHALVGLSRVIPDELTSLMFEPAGKHVGTNEPSDGDLDALAREATHYSADYLDATDPKSPGGMRIVPREAGNLKDRARRMASTARRAAA